MHNCNATTCTHFEPLFSFYTSIIAKREYSVTNNLDVLIDIFANLKDRKRGHDLHSSDEVDVTKTAEDVISVLSTELVKLYKKFATNKATKANAFEYTLQLFLLSVLRDCGFVPTEEINDWYEKKQWARTTVRVNSLLNENFKNSLPDKEIVNLVYDETRYLCARLDVVPRDCLGIVYEKLLRHTEAKASATSFYTPAEHAAEIMEKLNISSNSKIIDPSCGSGTFLTTALEILFPAELSIEDARTASSFIQNNLRGVDKEKYSCAVSKTMLLACYATLVGVDFARGNYTLPNLSKTIIHKDFFQFDDNFKATHVVGNAPWGNVDDKSKKENILPQKMRHKIKLERWYSYDLNIDISLLFLELIVKTFPKAQIGLMVKQQAIHGKAKRKFKTWVEGLDHGFHFYDYGNRRLFKNLSSLTAVAYRDFSNRDTNFDVVDKGVSLPPISANMISFSQYFHFFEAFEAHPIFYAVAERLCDGLSAREIKMMYPFIKSTYPTNEASVHFNLPKKLRRICYITNGVEAPIEFLNELTVNEKRQLKARKIGQKDSTRDMSNQEFPYNFRGTQGREYYHFDNDLGVRIALPIHFNPLRCKAMIDPMGTSIPIKEHTAVLIPKNLQGRAYIYAVLGWMNSKYFYAECIRSKLKFLSADRMKFQGSQKNDIGIPKELLNEEFSTYIKNRFVGQTVTKLMLEELDAKIGEFVDLIPYSGSILGADLKNLDHLKLHLLEIARLPEPPKMPNVADF